MLCTFSSPTRVLYFSIHRYEQGSFWPNLRESNYDYIGQGAGKGFNFNVPLNCTGMANQDFLAILHQVLLPVAYEVGYSCLIHLSSVMNIPGNSCKTDGVLFLFCTSYPYILHPSKYPTLTLSQYS